MLFVAHAARFTCNNKIQKTCISCCNTNVTFIILPAVYGIVISKLTQSCWLIAMISHIHLPEFSFREVRIKAENGLKYSPFVNLKYLAKDFEEIKAAFDHLVHIYLQIFPRSLTRFCRTTNIEKVRRDCMLPNTSSCHLQILRSFDWYHDFRHCEYRNQILRTLFDIRFHFFFNRVYVKTHTF